MSRDELASLRPVAVSMGIMLETTADRLGAREALTGRRRTRSLLVASETMSLAGRAADPVHERHPDRDRRDAGGAAWTRSSRPCPGGRIRPPAGGDRPEPRQAGYEDGLAPRAVARRAPLDDRGGAHPAGIARPRPGAAEPGLRRLSLPPRRRHRLGRVSPVTIDHVNPEAPWPEVERLAAATRSRGLELAARLPVYPEYLGEEWLDENIRPRVLRVSDAMGLAREDDWAPGSHRHRRTWARPRRGPARAVRRGLGRGRTHAPVRDAWARAGAGSRRGRPAPPRNVRATR